MNKILNLFILRKCHNARNRKKLEMILKVGRKARKEKPALKTDGLSAPQLNTSGLSAPQPKTSELYDPPPKTDRLPTSQPKASGLGKPTKRGSVVAQASAVGIALLQPVLPMHYE